MKDIDTVKKVISWRNKHNISDYILFTYHSATGEFVDPLKSEFIWFSFKKENSEEEYPVIDYLNPVKLCTTKQE